MRWIYLDNRVFYCPSDVTIHYEVTYNYVKQYDGLDYCPQDTTGFYDFAQQP